jgi:3-oxoacyl-[acyl-carrier-protein] synthase I
MIEDLPCLDGFSTSCGRTNAPRFVSHSICHAHSFLFLSTLSLLSLSPSFSVKKDSRRSSSSSSSGVACTVLCMSTTSARGSSSSGGLRRVVVTGMGIVSCLGNTLEEVTKSLHEAKSGLSFSQECADLGIKSQVRGIPSLTDEDFKELVPKAALRFCGKNAQYAYVAMDRAIQDSGLKPEEFEENPRVAAIIGQGGTSIPDIVETVEAVQSGNKRWKNKVGPFRVTRSMGSTCSAVLATSFKVQGPSFSISSACSTGAHCIGTGMEQIQLDKADIAFCGAGE